MIKCNGATLERQSRSDIKTDVRNRKKGELSKFNEYILKNILVLNRNRKFNYCNNSVATSYLNP